MDLTLPMLKSTTNFFSYTMCCIFHISFNIYGFSCYYNVDCIFLYLQVATLNTMCCVITAKPDMVGTIILNPSALSSATLSIAEDEKIYHLVNYSNCTTICSVLYWDVVSSSLFCHICKRYSFCLICWYYYR